VCMIRPVGYVVSKRLDRFSDNLDRWAGSAGGWVETHWLWVLVWAVGAGVFLALLAPICSALGLEQIARPIYSLYSHICHQRPDRTLWVMGYPMAFCARDTGLYGGLWLGMLTFAAWRRPRLSHRMALLLVLPLALDGGSQLTGMRQSTNWLRLSTGMLAGLATVWYLLPRLVASMTSKSSSSDKSSSEDATWNRTCQEA